MFSRLKSISLYLLIFFLSSISFAQTDGNNDINVMFRYFHTSNQDPVRVHFPGQFNDWGPNSEGTIASGAVSQGMFNASSGFWEKKIVLTRGSTYQYKIYLQRSNDPSDWQWILDPLNDATLIDDGFENSAITVSDLNFFQVGVFPYEIVTENNKKIIQALSQKPNISFGLFFSSANSLASLNISLDGTPIPNAASYYNASTGIFSYTPSANMTSGDHTFIVEASISGSAKATDRKEFTFRIPKPLELITPSFSTLKSVFKVGGKVVDPTMNNVSLSVAGGGSFSASVTNGRFLQEINLDDGDNVVTVGAGSNTETITITKIVESEPKARVKAVSTSAGSVTLSASESERAVSYEWMNVKGVDLGLNGKTGITTIVNVPNVHGDYPFMLVATGANGQKDTVRNYFTVLRDGSVKLPEQWDNPSWVKEARAYMLFPKAASSQETNIFRDIINKGKDPGGLEYIKLMGFNVIWILPVMKVDGNGGAIDNGIGIGFNIIDFYDFATNYGTSQDFKDLVDKAHELGLKVILDVTPNHTSRNHAWAINARSGREASPYWSWYQHDKALGASNTNGLGIAEDADGFVYYAGFSDALLNYEWSDVDARKAMIDVYKYWMKKYDLDGYRFDVYWGPHRRYGRDDFDMPLREELKRIKGDIYLLAETAGTGVGTESVYAGRLEGNLRGGADAAYDWTLKGAVQKSWQGVASVSGINILHNAIENNNYYPSESSYFMRFLENKDEDRVAYLYRAASGVDQFLTYKRSVVVGAAIFMAPGQPLLYNGQEVGIGFPTTALNPGEPDLNVRRRGVINWLNEGRVINREYQKLAHIRAQFPALWTQTIHRVDDASGQFYAFTRPYRDQNILVSLNFSHETQTKTLDVSSSVEFSDGSGDMYFLNELMNGESKQVSRSDLSQLEINLTGYQVKVYSLSTKKEIVDIPELIETSSLSEKLKELGNKSLVFQNYPNPFKNETTIEYILEKRSYVDLKIYDAIGRLIAVLENSVKNPGRYQAVFKSENLSTGNYFYTIRIDGESYTKKMIHIR